MSLRDILDKLSPPARFARVDDKVWRGARPSLSNAGWLRQRGVETVINLELTARDRMIWAAPVNYIHLMDWEPLPWFAASLSDHHILDVIRTIRNFPSVVYIHCRSGQNRTGVAVAAYEILELNRPLNQVLAQFASYRGFWAWGDENYLRTVAARRQEFLTRIALKE